MLPPLLFLTGLTLISYASAIAKAPCTATIGTYPHLTSGPTETVYISTSTYISTVDCDGCTNVVATPNVRVPIPLHFTTTVTAMNATVTTAYACSMCGVGTGRPTPCPQ